MGSSSIIMRSIIFTLSALLAFAVAEREFNLCARAEKVCPGGVKPKTPCADGSQPRCPSGRTDTCKPKWKRCADRSEPVRQCATGNRTAHGPPRTGTTHGANRYLFGLLRKMGQIDVSSIRCMLIAFPANISQQHLTNLKNGENVFFGEKNPKKLGLKKKKKKKKKKK